jgi:hypothetical protein|tara:strand:- start:62 stop:529 length:468 start_codon:yes stop_codon:yes gene_type:complete
MDIDIKLKHEPTHLTDYRMVKLTDGTLLVGSITVEGNFLRIDNALQLATVNRMTDYGVKEDSTLTPWIPFCSETSFNISREKIMVITLCSQELAHYYEVIKSKVKKKLEKAPLSPEEMEHIMQVAEEMDREELIEKENEIDEMFNGHKVTSKTLH